MAAKKNGVSKGGNEDSKSKKGEEISAAAGAGERAGQGSGEASVILAATNEPVYSLAELHTRTGGATDEEVLVFVQKYTKAQLVEEGAQVATFRIDTDSARLYGKAVDFFGRATEAQKDELPAITPKFLRVGIAAAVRGSRLAEQREAALRRSGAAKGGRAVDAGSAQTRGLARREQLYATIKGAIAGDERRMSLLNAAYGTASTYKELVISLYALVTLGREVLADPSLEMTARLEDSRFTAAWLDRSEALAAEVKKAGELGNAPMADATVAQADVDYWDGINLALITSLIDAFEAGHLADPSIPRLVPIALRPYFGWKGRTEAKKGAATPAGEVKGGAGEKAAEKPVEKPEGKPAEKGAEKPAEEPAGA